MSQADGWILVTNQKRSKSSKSNKSNKNKSHYKKTSAKRVALSKNKAEKKDQSSQSNRLKSHNNIRNDKNDRKDRPEKKGRFARRNITIDGDILKTFDPLSLAVYCILIKFEHPLPASAIKKEVNMMIKVKKYPSCLSEQCQNLKDEYTKKEIGWVLYEGPLQEHLQCNQEQVPRLWKLVDKQKSSSLENSENSSENSENDTQSSKDEMEV